MRSELKDIIKRLRKDLDGPCGKELWDVLTGLRGPDWPSEKGGDESMKMYRLRRRRKFLAGEVIRGASFPGVGGARHRTDDHIILPPESRWDHYDKHMDRAARALGLTVTVDNDLDWEKEVAK